ncbi:MAG: oxidoreductase [Microbacteriaceae bacterium]|jgi:predicted dinucleotide-binding enzyme|nr:oxidoreductase [Microbacteriaceae bacterium]
MTTIGFIGSGHIGSQVARKAIENGYDVVLSNSRGPATLQDLVAELGEHARAATREEAAAAADVAVVSIPFKAIADVPVDQLAGKIVLDTNNYYWERDGHVADLDDGTSTVTAQLQAHLPESRVAKAFNAIASAQITSDGLPAGTDGRRALVTASDHADAADFVVKLYDEFGFDTINLGPLSESWRVERDRPAYGMVGDVAAITEALARAQRTL